MMGKDSYSVSGDLHHAEVGSFTSIAGGVTVHGNDNHAWVYSRDLVSTFPFRERWEIEGYPSSGNTEDIVLIGNDVWICESVSILPGVVIGDGAIVGAHSVVAKDVPSYAIVVGNPGRVVGYRFNNSQIKSLLKIKWWEWDNKDIRERIEDFKDINTFIKKYENT